MLVLILSILALFAGVGIYPVIKSRPSMISFFDAFVLISVIGLTLMHLIPHSVEGAGLWAVAAVCLGFGIPAMLHKMPHQHDEHDNEPNRMSQVLLVIALIGVVTHTLLDGIGLSMSHVHETEQTNNMMLGLGVLFHRLPVGLFLGMMLIPKMGYRRTIGIATAMATATLIGFGLGHVALPMASLTLLNVIQGLIAGTLLHVIFHNVSLQGRTESPWPKGIGALFGLVTLILIEVLTPGHGHTHASVLEIWIEYLWQAAPIWCGFAGILALAYALKPREHHHHNHVHDEEHHEKPSKLQLCAQFVCHWLDPQPMPALYGNTIHIFSAASLIALATLFKTLPAFAWWGAALLCLILFKLAYHPLHICASCRPESLCNQHKSFGLWMASSWTQVAGILFIAAVLPALLGPLTEVFTHLPTPLAWTLLGCLCLIAIGIAAKKRGLPLLPCQFIAFTAFILFAEIPFAQIFIGITAIALLCLYDFHPRDIRNAVDTGTPWFKRYLIASCACLILLGAACYISMHHSHAIHPHALAHFEVHGHEHAHAHDIHQRDNIEFNHHLDHNNKDIIKSIETEHNHDIDINHNIDNEHLHQKNIEIPSDHDTVIDPHDLHTDHVRYLNLRMPFFILFLLAGLFWLLRMGPRKLFETALGKHHHDHG